MARSLRILVVDDDPAMVGAITALVGTEGHQVITAYDGLTAVRRLREEAPDIVLLDLAMPGPDGFAVAGQVRAAGATPILVVSGENSEAAKVRALGLGADDYLTKPFAFAELLVRVKALLRRGSVNRSSTLRVGDLELDRLTQQVKRGARRIDLTAKEYSLLEYLMQNAERVLSRNMIIEHVWDQSFDGITNIVDVYVRHLRSKVDDGFNLKLIRTIRGTGYMIRGSQEA